MNLVLKISNPPGASDAGPAPDPEFVLSGDSALIGRSPGCDWTLPDSNNFISSRHGEISRNDRGFVFKDISTNGTFLNRAPERMTEERLIEAGDLFKIGPYEIVAALTADAPAAPPPPAPPPPPPAPPTASDPERTMFQAASEGPAAESDVVLDGKLWGEMEDANAVDWDRGGFGEENDALAAIAAAGSPEALAALLLDAAGIESGKVTTAPAETIAKAGGLLRRLVSGMVVMVEARARAKSQMGAEATQLQLTGNNPIKFARTPQGALAQLLNPTEKGFMDADKAVEDAFVDLQSHQVATLAAIPGALRTTLERFSPGSIKRRAEDVGILGRIMPSRRDAALWHNYEREFAKVASESDAAFMEVFAKEFRKAYAKQTAAQAEARANAARAAKKKPAEG